MIKTFVLANGEKYGPYTLEKLRSHVKSGNFKDSYLCCYDGECWIPIHQIPGYIKELPPTPPKKEKDENKKN